MPEFDHDRAPGVSSRRGIQLALPTTSRTMANYYSFAGLLEPLRPVVADSNMSLVEKLGLGSVLVFCATLMCTSLGKIDGILAKMEQMLEKKPIENDTGAGENDTGAGENDTGAGENGTGAGENGADAGENDTGVGFGDIPEDVERIILSFLDLV